MNIALCCCLWLFFPGATTTGEGKLMYPDLVNRFYTLHQRPLFWFAHNAESYEMRYTLREMLDSSEADGLDKSKYHYNELLAGIDTAGLAADPARLKMLDRVFTDAAIAWCRDMYTGAGITSRVSYDGISKKYTARDNNYLLNGLALSQTAGALREFMQSLIPRAQEYTALKTALRQHPVGHADKSTRQLVQSLNIYRWMHHFKFDKWVEINIAAATLRYCEYDSIKIRAKVVVGKPSTRTPRFAAYCNQVVLYPYWNVPHSIAVKELLPIFKRLPFLVDSLDMRVLDAAGHTVDPHSLDWASFSQAYFPYSVRQSTGCNNALGVVKFNLNSPYDVYMHDTNLKSAFSSVYRYYSHGCIRVEKPVELATALLPGRIDSAFLRACYKDLRPISIDLEAPVPVFVVYATAVADSTGKVSFYRDIYHLLH
ncbi:MAG TPA: L,D-transpeptidase family protein [Chitinophagaceae bacterium]|nr:L,D-transpeptidase family protein [Chitinophagaceae bacterium]